MERLVSVSYTHLDVYKRQTLGYQTGSRIDGIFGARTEEALKGFQRRTSLRVDGVCGCSSWKKITTAVIGIDVYKRQA